MIELIEKYICRKESIDRELLHEINGNGKISRKREICECRQLVIYYAMRNHYSEREASDYYGLDHSTANHIKRKFPDLIQTDKQFRTKIEYYDKALLRLCNKNTIDNINLILSNNKMEEVIGLLNEIDIVIDEKQKELNTLKLIIFDLRKETMGTDLKALAPGR